MGFRFSSRQLISFGDVHEELIDTLTPRQARLVILECADSSAPKDSTASRNKTQRGRAPALQNKTSFLPTPGVN